MTYTELGLVSPVEMMRGAYRGGYAIGAFNFVFMEQLLAITDAAIAEKSPFILQSSANTCRDLGVGFVRALASAGAQCAAESGVPMALHLDHGLSFEECRACVDNGFSSVMIDGSALPFSENVALTERVARYAHDKGVSVEGELGVLSGQEGSVDHERAQYTDPEAVREFVERTGVDYLAVSVGSCHGVVKIRPNQDGTLPELRFDILEAISEALPGFPIVLHGSSCIYPQYVNMVNENGGQVTAVQGIPEEQVIRAARETAVCKINVASDGWIAATAAMRRALAQNPSSIDPRTFLRPARAEMTALYRRKISVVMGSSGK